MNKPLFVRIVADLTARFEYFSQTDDATGRPGFTNLQKCVATVRLLAYGYAADAIDEYLRMASPTAHQALLEFVEGIIALYGEKKHRLYAVGVEELSYHLERPIFTGKPTIVLEVVASYDLWIWHAFFGPLGGIYPNWPTFIQSIKLPKGPKAKRFAKRQEGV
ncbi:unnamed protein product [Microthlaspi erraticum]|uniref:Uncharacterized protein n=1 Tax=Microthlaspi erraticum TaxID=1685480 RepID=A0A6D2IC94_9BRAS|nr:unnamed protein product [Microthlaspi erraticum]